MRDCSKIVFKATILIYDDNLGSRSLKQKCANFSMLFAHIIHVLSICINTFESNTSYVSLVFRKMDFMTWFFLIEQASVAEFNETQPNSGKETKKKMFWKTYPQGLQLNKIQSNHPQVTSYDSVQLNTQISVHNFNSLFYMYPWIAYNESLVSCQQETILRLVYQTQDGHFLQNGCPSLQRCDCVWYVRHAMYCARITWINRGSLKNGS